MTPEQWRRIAERVQFLWGRSVKWVKAADPVVYDEARRVSFDAATLALDDLLAVGEPHAPSIPELLRKARLRMPSVKFDRDACTHPEPWMLLHDPELAVCRVCGVEWAVPV